MTAWSCCLVAALSATISVLKQIGPPSRHPTKVQGIIGETLFMEKPIWLSNEGTPWLVERIPAGTLSTRRIRA